MVGHTSILNTSFKTTVAVSFKILSLKFTWCQVWCIHFIKLNVALPSEPRQLERPRKKFS
jgi:hypothetical protein